MGEARKPIEILFEVLASKKITQQTIAEKMYPDDKSADSIRNHASYLSKFVKGHRELNADIATRICNAVNSLEPFNSSSLQHIRFDWLMGYDAYMTVQDLVEATVNSQIETETAERDGASLLMLLTAFESVTTSGINSDDSVIVWDGYDSNGNTTIEISEYDENDHFTRELIIPAHDVEKLKHYLKKQAQLLASLYIEEHFIDWKKENFDGDNN